MTFLKIIFFTFYVYNSFKITKRSIIKLVCSAFAEYKMHIFLYAKSNHVYQIPVGRHRLHKCPTTETEIPNKCPGVGQKGGEGERWALMHN